MARKLSKAQRDALNYLTLLHKHHGLRWFRPSELGYSVKTLDVLVVAGLAEHKPEINVYRLKRQEGAPENG